MNKIRFITLSIFIVFISTGKLLAITPELVLNDSHSYFAVNDLSKKKYYEEIFNKKERKQLKKAEKYLTAARKYMLQYDADKREIEKLYTIAEATSSPKSRQKSLKKARTLEEKALKKGFKALRYFKTATDIQSKIYTTAINRCRLTDDSKNSKLGREIELQAKAIFESAKTKERMAPQHDDQLKFNALREAMDMTLKALEMQETAFGFYKNDPSVNADEYNIENNTNVADSTNIVKQDSVLFPVYVEQYNPVTDPNLYRSKANLILPRLNLTNAELTAIVEANKKNQYANDLIKQVDQAYLVVDSLNYVADRTENFSERDRIRNAAIEKEQSAFYKLTNATNIYLNVNDTRYKIYKTHFPVIAENKKTPQTENAKKYELEADTYYQKAKQEISQANNLMYRSEQYIKLMGANDMLLYALQLQESAYGIYFNMPEAITTLIDTSFVTENTLNTGNISIKEDQSNLNWELLARYTYSKSKPKPVKYTDQNGVVFLVQFGILKGLVPTEKFGTIQPLVFDRFVKNPYRRYMAGEYRTHEAAQLALDKVKGIGYKDAYIICLYNGQRRSLSFGQANVNPSDEHYAHLRRMEIAKINGQQISTNIETDIKTTGTISGNSVTNTSGLLYFVQLGTYLNPVSYEDFKNLQPIYTEKVAGKGTRYLLGTFAKISVARDESQKVKNMGFKDAYVTAYYNGEHITLDRAKKLEKQQYGTVASNTTNTNNTYISTTTSSGNITFKVQVGAYSQQLSATEINKLQNKFAPRNIDHKFAGGLNVYTIGNYTTYNEAKYLKNKLVDEGHNGVFVVAFEGDNKIPVGEAIKKSN